VRRPGARPALLLLLLAACAGEPPSLAPAESGSVAVAPARALALRHRAEGFYLRFAHRRFNTLETYSDYIMRDHFQSLDLYFDYDADLVEDLVAEDFEKCRPRGVDVLELIFDDDANARVLVRFRGDDGRPLRPGSTELVREDRWEWSDGAWWVRPGKV
jgi:hypothetical protein